MWVGCVSGALCVAEYERILKSVGFSGVEITPVNVYTLDAIKGIAASKGVPLPELDYSMDGAFAGAHVKAYK